MEARAWRLAAGAAAAVVAVVVLVAWRAGHLAGAWAVALRVAGLVAVVGLLAVVVLTGRLALRPPAPREVRVHVPVDGSGAARVLPPVTGAPSALAQLRALLLAAAVVALPALVVLVWAPDASDHGTDLRPAAAATTAPSSAAPSSSAPTGAAPSPSATGPPSPSATGPPGAPAPDPPASPSAPGTAPGTAPGPPGCSHVVAAGDTLWSIAAEQLGAGAGPAAVDARWRALYAADRAAVGPDPGLIHPGLVLDTCT